jgi:DNA-binding NarL/FixJ family response regulator
VHTILIVKADQLYAEALRDLVLGVFPAAVVKLAHTVESASRAVAGEVFDLLVTGLGASLGGDMLDFISDCTDRAFHTPRVLVVTTHREPRVLSALRNLPVQGVFDSTAEHREKFIEAVAAVAGGRRYCSPTLAAAEEPAAGPRDPYSNILTTAEQMVLSIIGDGCDDETAADRLGLSASTISTVRRSLHRKLRLQHRGELVRFAAQSGFVRFTPSGVLRTGFGMLTAAHWSRKAKPSRLAVA